MIGVWAPKRWQYHPHPRSRVRWKRGGGGLSMAKKEKIAHVLDKYRNHRLIHYSQTKESKTFRKPFSQMSTTHAWREDKVMTSLMRTPLESAWSSRSSSSEEKCFSCTFSTCKASVAPPLIEPCGSAHTLSERTTQKWR